MLGASYVDQIKQETSSSTSDESSSEFVVENDRTSLTNEKHDETSGLDEEFGDLGDEVVDEQLDEAERRNGKPPKKGK
jgi:hypothetical protein